MTTTINNEHKKLNAPNLRFPEFEGEWETSKLGEICNVLMCKRILASQTNTEEGVPFYKIGTIGGTPDAFISKELFDTYRKKYNYPRKGEVMITCAGTVGKCIIYDGKDAYFQDSNIVWIDNNSRSIENEFLYHLVSKIDWRKLNSTTIVRIYNDDLRNIKLCYPNVHEQKKIAKLLSLLDERIATQNKVIDKLQSLIKGINQEVFNEVGCRHKLGNICEIKSGYSGNQLIKKEGLKVSRIETISGHRINLERVGYVSPFKNSESYKLQVGDILFSNINSVEYIGNTAFVDKDYDLYHGMNLLRLIPNSKVVVPFYLYLLLNTCKMLNRFKTICNKAVSQASINQTDLSKTIIVLPSLENQIKICNIYEVLFSKIEAEKNCLSLYNAQKQYLLRQMFI